MSISLQETKFYEILSHPDNFASTYIRNELMIRDIWVIKKDLPSLAEAARLRGMKTLNFGKFKLSWLKDLVKIVMICKIAHQKYSLSRCLDIRRATSKFDAWLHDNTYTLPSALNPILIQEWEATTSDKNSFSFFTKTLKELGLIDFVIDNQTLERKPKFRAIKEEVKQKLDIGFEDLEKPIYLIFKLMECLGLRSMEIAKIPLNCLSSNQEINLIFIKRGKQKDRKSQRALLEKITPLIKEQ